MKWKPVVKRFGIGVAVVAGLVVAVALFQIVGFGRAAARTYDVPPFEMVASTDSAVLARGQHLAESLGQCFACHGEDLSGRLVEDLGPIGVIRAPNITRGSGGLGPEYSDSDFARAVRHGVATDGRSLLFMPTIEHNWWPDEDLIALVSYVRSVPPVDSSVDPPAMRPLGKILTQFGAMNFLSASMIDHGAPRNMAPAPAPTAQYGSYLARGCVDCHGERFSGGKMPGAPASLPIPLNLTPHETGLGSWTEDVFMQVLDTGIRPDGRTLDPFMPIAGLRAMNETERKALWAYLRTLEPLEFGNR